MKTLLEHRQHDRMVSDGTDRTRDSSGLSGCGRHLQGACSAQKYKLFLQKRSPLSIKEKKKEKTEERATLR